MLSRLFFFVLAVLFLLTYNPAVAQYFGKNKVTRQQYDWQIHRSDHFDIYYYEGSSRLVTIMANIAEEAYEQHSQDLQHQLSSRTPLILYQSHVDFRDTNIILDELSEGVGGFAEIFKRRVVIPFTGSLRDFREVIFHELVHIFQYDIIYQKPFARIYSGEFLYSAPIWFIEGAADYLANDVDAVGKMVLRDACVNNQIPSLTDLENFYILGPQVYLGYKIGQSAVGYLVDNYGREKIGELMHELRQSRTKDLNQSMKTVIGMSLETFDEKWQRAIKKQYFPLVQSRAYPQDVAKNLTKDSKYSHSIQPAFSPSGDLVAYITGNAGFSEIVLSSTKDGKQLFRVSRSFFRSKYEEIRTEGRALSWSPDGNRIAFFVNHRSEMYILIINVVTRKLETRIRLEFDSVQSPSYNATGDKIVFSALKNGQTDLFVLDLAKHKIDYLTKDPFNDQSPVWHPVKGLVTYVSERSGRDQLVILDVESKTKRLVDIGQHNVATPSWSRESEKLIFCADISGVFDLFTLDLSGKNEQTAESPELVRLSQLLAGCSTPQFSSDERKIIFSAYQNGKRDIYMLASDDPLLPENAELVDDLVSPVITETPIREISPTQKTTRIAKRKYKTNLAVDAIFSDFNLGADGILRNTTDMIASDMMGNHRFAVSMSNHSTIRQSVYGETQFYMPDFVANYGYFPRKADFGVSIFNYHQYHLFGSTRSRGGVFQRITGLGGYVSYPFNRYHRLDLQTQIYTTPFSYNYYLSRPSFNSYDQGRGLLFLGIASLVSDTTIWHSAGPFSGHRMKLTLEKSFDQAGSDLDLTTIVFDIRKYFRLGRRSSFAMRTFLGSSFGQDQSLFYLGGIDTLRGYGYEAFIGTRMGLINFELRVPLIDEIRLAWPFVFSIGGVRGMAFADFGTVWSPFEFNENNAYQPFQKGRKGYYLDDIKGSVGLGMRLRLGYFSLDFAIARRTNLQTIQAKPVYHFGLGQTF